MRLKFPKDELVFPWLGMLFDAYAVIDEGIKKAVKKEEKRLKKKLACKRGCSNCCLTQTDIPVYPLELNGIYWYVSEKMDDPLRDALKENASSNMDGCLFLIDSVCSIHPLRPVSCRQFNVFGRPCEAGKDPFYTRRGDVLTPIEEYTARAFSAMLPFYGFSGDDLKDPLRTLAVKEVIHTRISNLRDEDRGRILDILDKARFR